MAKLVNRAKMTTATTGTGTITLGSAVDGYQSFADAGVTDAAVVSYAIEDGTAWEIGTGTYTTSGTTLSRTVTESSNAGAAINLSGNAVVFVTARAEDLATGGGAPTLATSSGATQSVDFSTSNKIHVATIDEDATLAFTNPASVAKLDLILNVSGSFFNLSGATGPTNTTSFASQDTQTASLKYGNSGTKLYVLGDTNDRIYQYTLTTPYDVSTRVYDSVFFSYLSQEGQGRGFEISDDGSRIFIHGWDNDTVYQYSLGTPFNVSTASYSGASLSVAGQDTVPMGLRFGDSGNVLFVSGIGSGAVHQYALAAPYDLSGASYSKSLSVGAVVGQPYGIEFNADGSKMFIIGNNSNGGIFQYSLPTPFDLSSGSYDSVVLETGLDAWDFIFTPNGDAAWALDVAADTASKFVTEGTPSLILPANLEAPTVPLVASEKTALTIVTYDGGTTYQAINVQGGIV